MGLVLAFDVGTTNAKAGLVSSTGELLASAEKQISILRPENRAAEHDPDKLFDTLIELGKTVSLNYEKQIERIVLSAYQFGLILLDHNFKPLTGLTTLLDTRARTVHDQFRKEFDGSEIYQKTGCPPFTQYPLVRLFYFQKNHPELLKQAKYILSAKAYLLFRFTGELISDPSTEAASQMLNMHSIDWDQSILAAINLNNKIFPKIYEALEVELPLLDSVRLNLGLIKKVCIIPGLYDGGALAVGLGGLKEDNGVINVGTSGMLRVLTKTPVLDSNQSMSIQTYYLMQGLYFAGGAINNATVPLNWLKANLTDGEYEDFMNEAGQAQIGSRKLFFLPYLTGERDWEIGSVASGVLFGLREFHTRSEVMRSALEGVAFCLNSIYLALVDADIKITNITIGGGGVRHPLWCQIIADVLGLPLQKTESKVACLVGNGILGQISLGSYKYLNEATQVMVSKGDSFYPNQTDTLRYKQYYNFYQRLFTGFKDLYREHALLDR